MIKFMQNLYVVTKYILEHVCTKFCGDSPHGPIEIHFNNAITGGLKGYKTHFYLNGKLFTARSFPALGGWSLCQAWVILAIPFPN